MYDACTPRIAVLGQCLEPPRSPASRINEWVRPGTPGSGTRWAIEHADWLVSRIDRQRERLPALGD